jgi:hypothetical protein
MDTEIYTHPETGEETEIPDGAIIERNEDGEIMYWSNPSAIPEGQLHPDHVEDYEPRFDPEGATRRVLGFVTQEEHQGRPRNTTAILVEDLADDPHSPFEYNEVEAVQKHLDVLEEAGLVEQDDGIYAVTDAGRVELAN